MRKGKTMDEYRFQVNLGGMIEILSDHLYSSPDVYVRELLQNGVDAIVGRKNADEEFDEKNGRLTLKIEEGKALTFTDNGLGLSKEEIHQFLAIIGESSKRDLETGRIQEEYIGRFGIGLLSCFMVSNRIVVRTHSYHDAHSLEWIGNPDGTYTITELAEELPIGTTIYLEAKKNCEDYFTSEKIRELVMHYGALLPYEIVLDDGSFKGRINPVKMPWDNRNPSTEELMQFGRVMLHGEFLDAFVLKDAAGNPIGAAYILNHTVAASTKQNHLIYLKHMLLTERGDELLPDWAVFVRCIINVNNLRPTASREGFYEDEVLEETRAQIGNSIIDHLKMMAKTSGDQFRYFMQVHSLVMRSMAMDNEELFLLFADYLDFVTTRGMMTGLDLRMSKEELLYADDDEYKQLSQIFTAQGRLLINTSYVYTLGLLMRLSEVYQLTIRQVELENVDEILLDVSAEQAEQSVDFLSMACKELKDFDCNAEMRKFMPANLPAFFYLNQEAVFLNEIREAKKNSDTLFGGMFDNFAAEAEELASATLFFNWNNPLVQQMVRSGNTARNRDLITILYVQTLLIGVFYSLILFRMGDNVLLEEGDE